MLNSATVGKDNIGNYVYKHYKVIRFTNFHPTYNSEAFFFNVLLRTISFRDENSSLSTDNCTGSYVYECYKRGLIHNTDSIMIYLHQYAERNLIEAENLSQFLESLLQEYPYLDAEQEANVNDFITTEDGTQSSDSSELLRNSKSPQHCFDINFTDMKLTEEQQNIFEIMNMNPFGLHVLNGTPESGKTYFIKYLTLHFQSMNKKVLLCGTTGPAALRLSKFASTAHTTFKIPVRGFYNQLVEPNETIDRLRESDIIIIDEISMMTSYMLTVIVNRLHQTSKTRNSNVFQTKLLLLVGDLSQLPAICTHRLRGNDIICRTFHIANNPLWNMAQKHELSNSVRHSTDPEFFRFLNIIRKTVPTQSEIDSVLSGCFITDTEIDDYITGDTTILCTHREDVAKYNNLVFHKKFSTVETRKVTIQTNASNVLDVADWLNNKRDNNIEMVASGCLVMFTENVSIKKGAVNGAVATVVSLLDDELGNIKTITVQIQNSDVIMNVKRKTFRNKYKDNNVYYKATFPIVLAYAITGHKSQGATISQRVLIDKRKAFTPGQTYVMLSKVTNRNNLKIKGTLIPSDFIPCYLCEENAEVSNESPSDNDLDDYLVDS